MSASQRRTKLVTVAGTFAYSTVANLNVYTFNAYMPVEFIVDHIIVKEVAIHVRGVGTTTINNCPPISTVSATFTELPIFSIPCPTAAPVGFSMVVGHKIYPQSAFPAIHTFTINPVIGPVGTTAGTTNVYVAMTFEFVAKFNN